MTGIMSTLNSVPHRQEGELELNQIISIDELIDNYESDHDPEPHEEPEQDADFDVEAVLDMKINNGVRYYLLKWIGYTNMHNTWEPESNLNCENLIAEYLEKHDNQIKSVSGICERDDTLHFIVKYPTDKTALIPINQAHKRFPKLALEFFEERLRWKHETTLKQVQSLNDDEVKRMREKTGNFSGGFSRGFKPECVMGVINTKDGLLVLLKWDGMDCIELVPAATVHENCPELLIKFYLERTEWKEPE